MALLILILVIGSIYAVPASASGVNISVEQDHIQATLALSFHQNMTNFPNESTTLTMNQNPELGSAFGDAIRNAEPSATVSGMTMRVFSNNTWLNLTASMTISGVFHNRGDLSVVNTTWKAFYVPQDLRIGNLSYNQVGKQYLRPVTEFYWNASLNENNPNATIKAVTFYLNQTVSVAGDVASDQVGNITVLDFRPLDVPVDQWNRTFSLSNNTTTWRYTPAPALAASIKAQKLNSSLVLFSDYNYTAEISVPGLARATGNSLLIDIGTGQKEWIMLSVVVLVIALAVAVQVLYWRKKKRIRLGRR
jgi:hypothetical protein